MKKKLLLKTSTLGSMPLEILWFCLIHQSSKLILSTAHVQAGKWRQSHSGPRLHATYYRPLINSTASLTNGLLESVEYIGPVSFWGKCTWRWEDKDNLKICYCCTDSRVLFFVVYEAFLPKDQAKKKKKKRLKVITFKKKTSSIHFRTVLRKRILAYSTFCPLNCLDYGHEMIRWEMFWKIMAWGSDSGAPVVKPQDVTIVKRAPNCSYYSVLIVAWWISGYFSDQREKPAF